MTMKPHPVTGWPVNEIEVRHGPILAEERATARVLLDEGLARWVVAAKLGRFPLAFNGTGRAPSEKRRSRGGNLSSAAARQDERQIAMDFFDDLFGPEGAKD